MEHEEIVVHMPKTFFFWVRGVLSPLVSGFNYLNKFSVNFGKSCLLKANLFSSLSRVKS
jgi:hypothetical protein